MVFYAPPPFPISRALGPGGIPAFPSDACPPRFLLISNNSPRLISLLKRSCFLYFYKILGNYSLQLFSAGSPTVYPAFKIISIFPLTFLPALYPFGHDFSTFPLVPSLGASGPPIFAYRSSVIFFPLTFVIPFTLSLIRTQYTVDPPT